MGYTQRDLADALGISLPSLREYEQSKSIPGGNVVALMSGIGWNANWVLIADGRMYREIKLTHTQREIVRKFHEFHHDDITCSPLAKARRNFIDKYSELGEHYEEDDFSWMYESHPEITLKELILWDISLSEFNPDNVTVDTNDFRETTLAVEREMTAHAIKLPLWAIGRIQELTINQFLKLEGIQSLMSLLSELLQARPK